MAKSIDRRSTTTAAPKPDTLLEERAAEVRENLDMSKTTGRLRRLGPGSRFIASFFAADKVNLPMRRGEVLGFLEMLSWHQSQHTMWAICKRGFLNLFRRGDNAIPAPDDLWARLALVFEERTVKPAIEAVRQELEADKDKRRTEAREALAAAKELDP